MSRSIFALATIMFATGAVAASTGPQRGEQLSLELLSDSAVLRPGDNHWLALRLVHDPHWHTYWRNPGDSGLPTRIQWQLPEGIEAGEIQWPYPQRLAYGSLTNLGYENETWLLTRLHVADSVAASDEPVDLTANVSYLVCQEECIPGKASITLSLPTAGSGQAGNDAHHDDFHQARQRLPVHSDAARGTASVVDGHIELTLSGDLPDRFELFPVVDGVFTNNAFTDWQRLEGGRLFTRHRVSDWFSTLPGSMAMVLVDTSTEPQRAYEIEVTAIDPKTANESPGPVGNGRPQY